MRLDGNTVIVATRNPGKVAEFAHAFAPLHKQVQSVLDYPHLPEVSEDGETFEANALLKARAIATALGQPALADDSGICVERLGGAPGVYSARFAGADATDQDNNAKLLRLLQELPEEAGLQQLAAQEAVAAQELASGRQLDAALRGVPDGVTGRQLDRVLGRVPGGVPDGVRLLSKASFACALVLYDPVSETALTEVGYTDGWVIDRPLGDGGFGYDPLFWVPELGRTMAQLSKAEKQAISHRGKALRKLLAALS